MIVFHIVSLYTFFLYCRHSANYVVSIMELKVYKYTKLHGLSKTNPDLLFVGFYLVCYNSFQIQMCDVSLIFVSFVIFSEVC